MTTKIYTSQIKVLTRNGRSLARSADSDHDYSTLPKSPRKIATVGKQGQSMHSIRGFVHFSHPAQRFRRAEDQSRRLRPDGSGMSTRAKPARLQTLPEKISYHGNTSVDCLLPWHQSEAVLALSFSRHFGCPA